VNFPAQTRGAALAAMLAAVPLAAFAQNPLDVADLIKTVGGATTM
jgi:hypothetical protein